jgi:uncharacterized protein YjbJ (UPF0337 family)
MNSDQIQGKWKQLTGSARERWGTLTDNDWQTVVGKKEQLMGRIQELCGIAKAQPEQQAAKRARAQKQSQLDNQLAGRL